MRNPFFYSLGLHAAFVVALIIAGLPGKRDTPLRSEITTVKLVKPWAPPPSAKPIEPKKEPEPEEPPAKKPLEIPDKSKPKDRPTLVKPDEPVKRAVQPKLERTGETSTLKLQDPGFEYDFYLAVVQSKIENNFRPPPGLKGQFTATVSFVILKDGKIDQIELTKKSGNLLLDQAAERAVRSTQKFPPLPAQYEKGQLEINFEFVVDPAQHR